MYLIIMNTHIHNIIGKSQEEGNVAKVVFKIIDFYTSMYESKMK